MTHLIRILIIGFVVSSTLFLQQCPTQPPDDPPEPGTLSVEYTTATEVWLRVQATETTDEAGLRVYRSDSAIADFAQAPADTVVIDTDLLPSTTYVYHTTRITNGTEDSPSDPLEVTTLPTTSHNFTWTIDTLGNPSAGSSVLHDVAIVDENNIWAVGEIHADSGLYGAAVWDGTRWKLKQLIEGTSNVRPRGIWAFSSSDIWFASGSIYHWDGQNTTLEWTRNIQSAETVEKVWGASPSNLYFVGNQGTIVHYNGSEFTRLESGTNTRIQDIWGAQDPMTGAWTILCAASPGYGTANSGIYQITPEQTVEPLPWVEGRAARSVWFDYPGIIFACGSGILRRVQGGDWEEIGGTVVIPASTERIRGQAANDQFIVGHFGYVAHYNGLDFRVWQTAANIYESCDYRHNLLVAVGYDDRRALVLRMWRE